jgi:hypothetical protein
LLVVAVEGAVAELAALVRYISGRGTLGDMDAPGGENIGSRLAGGLPGSLSGKVPATGGQDSRNQDDEKEKPAVYHCRLS